MSFPLTFKGGWRAEDAFFGYRRPSPSGLQEGLWGLKHQVTDCKEHLAKAGEARGWGRRGSKQPQQTYCLRLRACLAKHLFEILVTVRWKGPGGSIQFHTICLQSKHTLE